MSAGAGVRVADPFAEHVSVMKAIYQEYQKKDDFDSIKFIESAVDDIHRTCAQQQGAIKDVIKSMSQEASGLEASSRYPQAEGSHARRMAALQADIKDIQDSIREMQENERDVGNQRAELQKRKEALAARMAQLDMAVAAEEPALRHQLSLFAHISKVMWKLDQEDRIAGTVSDPKRGDIIRIDLDPSAMTHFEAVNKLWGIID